MSENPVVTLGGPGQVDLLPDLWRQIGDEVHAAKQAGRNVMLHIKRAGELLNQAKEQIPHGGWLSWLDQHCGLEESTAEIYMKIAKHWGFLQSKTDHDPDLLNVREARRPPEPCPAPAG